MEQMQDEFKAAGPPSDANDSAEQLTGTPRVWTVFVAVLLAFVAMIVVLVVAAVTIAAGRVAGGVDPSEAAGDLVADLSTPPVFILIGIATQLAIGLAALIPALLSPRPTLLRIGLVRPILPVWEHLVIMIGGLLPFAVGVTLAHLIALVIPPDPSFSLLYEQMSLPWAVPFILFVALAPGFMEELLFRGYVQTRLLQRWRPWVAILVTASIFGLFHITPHPAANAFVLGLWFGLVAWRTGSVWPAIACHAFINGVWNTWHVGQRFWGFPETPSLLVTVCGGSIVVACFLLSIWLLWTRHDPA